ncbi:chymotrypsinogen B-like [Schistocerca piceifrons]|uniref:chymotrypsinogen B-like n=1 Tax=Schistocerca piceifrons TaxID=274613 RepID=UPI001F5EB50B|nr:chymotrypsinogen B-like [Schistocerca piceifrons]
MVRAVVALLCLQACALAAPRAGTPSPRRVRGRIINGTDASVADFPWMLSMEAAGEQFPSPSHWAPTSSPSASPPDGYEAPAGLPVTATGWGATEEVWYPDVLQRVDVEVLDRSVCEEHLGSIHTVTASMLCAGQEGHGDSGSPLVHNGTQLGTVSWGQPTCVGPAAVYGNVASVGSWIRNTTEA